MKCREKKTKILNELKKLYKDRNDEVDESIGNGYHEIENIRIVSKNNCTKSGTKMLCWPVHIVFTEFWRKFNYFDIENCNSTSKWKFSKTNSNWKIINK